MQSNLNNRRDERFRALLYYRFHVDDKYPVDVIAEKMGVHKDTLYRWINGTNVFPANEIIGLIQATNDIKYLEFIADKCGYSVIPKIKDRKTAEAMIMMAKIFLSATGENLEKK